LQHNVVMSKTAILPQVRVEADFRAQAEAVLRPGESLSELVEASVRRVVEHRQVQSEFHARGQAAWEHYKATGVSYSTDEVLVKMRAMTAARRAELERKAVERQA
jgi:Arc/MetJ-type ribon-helix-helix transcriptional regulator